MSYLALVLAVAAVVVALYQLMWVRRMARITKYVRENHDLDNDSWDPAPPQNVRIVYPDGTVYPVEVSYHGQNDDGLHVWDAHTQLHNGAQIKIDVMPPHTVLSFPMEVQPDEDQ